MKKIFLSFDFYGAGNIGDDLMLKGFLEGMGNSDFEYYCYIPRSNEHQKNRFPEINFIAKDDRERISRECSIWIGAGDTPIQVKSGDWFINKLQEDSACKRKNNFKYYFIGIGAEKEAVIKKRIFKEILKDVDYFWSRDKMTTDVLVDSLEVDKEKVTTSSDLANIFLRNHNHESEKTDFKHEAGICYYDENTEEENLKEIKKFVKKNFKKNEVLFFGNEASIKGNYETAIFRKMYGKSNRIFNRGINYYSPDYLNEKRLENLISHYNDCRIVMTTRYHALLTAAWKGCRVVSLERSSKVTSLSKELGVEEVTKPYTQAKLLSAFLNAKAVDRNLLEKLYEKAAGSLFELKNKL